MDEQVDTHQNETTEEEPQEEPWWMHFDINKLDASIIALDTIKKQHPEFDMNSDITIPAKDYFAIVTEMTRVKLELKQMEKEKEEAKAGYRSQLESIAADIKKRAERYKT